MTPRKTVEFVGPHDESIIVDPTAIHCIVKVNSTPNVWALIGQGLEVFVVGTKSDISSQIFGRFN